MAPKAGQKRSASTQNGEAASSSNHKSKKTRFVEPDEDPIDFAEQVDANLEQSTRKGRVKNEGYDSDSTDDGEGVVESRKKGGKDEDDVDDMFGVEDDEESKAPGGKKEDKFMRLADIEGQEFGDDGKSGSESSEEEEEPEDEDDAERKRKAGMGFELTSFNMRDEMDEGKFTEDGSYVRTFDPNAVHDRWMEGLNEKEIKLARRRKREQEKAQKQKQLEEERELEEAGGKAKFEKDLLPFLKKGETIVEALQRLGLQAKKSKSKTKPASTTHAPNDVETITHLASTLMSLGDVDIYNKTYEELVRSVRSSGLVGQDWVPPSADVKYEYKWATPEAGQPDETFGPFGEEEIKSWYNALYFGSAGEKIKVRKVAGEWGDWDDVVL